MEEYINSLKKLSESLEKVAGTQAQAMSKIAQSGIVIKEVIQEVREFGRKSGVWFPYTKEEKGRAFCTKCGEETKYEGEAETLCGNCAN